MFYVVFRYILPLSTTVYYKYRYHYDTSFYVISNHI